MPSLKDIKTQINSVGSTKKITSAMKMVAASKLRRSQEKAEAARPYSSRLEEMLSSLASSAASGEGIIKLLTGTGNDQNYIVVPVSADRGLCGGFNSSINRETFKLVKSLEGNGKKVQLMPVGKKSRDFFNRVMKDQIIESFVDLNVSSIGYESALNISNKLQELYFDGKFDKCILVFNKFKSAISQEVTKQQLILTNTQQKGNLNKSSRKIRNHPKMCKSLKKKLEPSATPNLMLLNKSGGPWGPFPIFPNFRVLALAPFHGKFPWWPLVSRLCL